MLASSLACISCGKSEEAEDKPSNLTQLREALPGAQVEPYDPRQSEKLGPAAVPGILPDSELKSRRVKALAGDGVAAYQLFHHYQLIGNSSESQFWTRIGAENGEYNSMMSMGIVSSQEHVMESCVRAIFWFTRAKAQLESDAPSHDTRILIQAVEEEIANVRKQTVGC
jgi:hypothetical protein